MGLTGKVNFRIPCLQRHTFSKTFVSLDMISGLQSTSSACTAGSYLSTTTAAEQEAKESTEAHSTLWAMVGSSMNLPFCSLSSSASLAEFPWPLLSTYLPAHPGDQLCCQPAQVTNVFALLWECSALPC